MIFILLVKFYFIPSFRNNFSNRRFIINRANGVNTRSNLKTYVNFYDVMFGTEFREKDKETGAGEGNIRLSPHPEGLSRNARHYLAADPAF